jgi:hypothetical protein
MNTNVGLEVMAETHRRLFKLQGVAMPKCLMADASNMSGYCIDAPDRMPAGSSLRVTVDQYLGIWYTTKSYSKRLTDAPRIPSNGQD